MNDIFSNIQVVQENKFWSMIRYFSFLTYEELEVQTPEYFCWSTIELCDDYLGSNMLKKTIQSAWSR